jgi:hypothetical protein
MSAEGPQRGARLLVEAVRKTRTRANPGMFHPSSTR